MNTGGKTPKVAIFLPSLDIGGVERVMLNLAEGLNKAGIEVDLVLTRKVGEFVRKIPNGVQVVDLRSPRVLTSLLPLVHYLRKIKPKALIVAKDYTNVVALVAKMFSSVPTQLVITIHTTPSKHFRYAKNFRERVFIRLLARMLYSRADSIIAVSKGVADDSAKFFRIPLNRINIIHNPVLSEEIYSAAKEPVNHPWFLPGNPPIILSVGRLTVAKDYGTLIKAFYKIRQQRQVRLVILGDGEEKQGLLRLIRLLKLENDVWLPGFVDPPYPYLARASVFVLSSIWEGFPTVIVEALALGVPVVSTNCPSGPNEILDNGRFGVLVPVGDAEKLANAILRTLNNPPDPERLKERAKQFSIENVIPKYLSILGISSDRNDIELKN